MFYCALLCKCQAGVIVTCSSIFRSAIDKECETHSAAECTLRCDTRCTVFTGPSVNQWAANAHDLFVQHLTKNNEKKEKICCCVSKLGERRPRQRSEWMDFISIASKLFCNASSVLWESGVAFNFSEDAYLVESQNMSVIIWGNVCPKFLCVINLEINLFFLI